jgi:hypothetical protein
VCKARKRNAIYVHLLFHSANRKGSFDSVAVPLAVLYGYLDFALAHWVIGWGSSSSHTPGDFTHG